MTTGQGALRQFSQAAKARRIADIIRRRAQDVRVQLIQAFLVDERRDLELASVGKLLAKLEVTSLYLSQAGSEQMFPDGSEGGGVKVRLVVPVPDDLSLLVLVAFGVVAGSDVAAVPELAAVRRVGEAAWPVEIGECL